MMNCAVMQAHRRVRQCSESWKVGRGVALDDRNTVGSQKVVWRGLSRLLPACLLARGGAKLDICQCHST